MAALHVPNRAQCPGLNIGFGPGPKPARAHRHLGRAGSARAGSEARVCARAQLQALSMICRIDKIGAGTLSQSFPVRAAVTYAMLATVATGAAAGG